ncbi:MAG: hypothetical protein LBE61_09685 [Burkholderiaceae bacterium]|jgi:hypothetical protein|nr:hypothetical protein [Burkholderiaceae bacterium]
MPIELLRKIKQLHLPVVLTDPAEVDKARVLRASGMIEADISEPGEPVQEADIRSITNLGLIATRIGEDPNET